jgi:hypothetical protein
MAVRVFFKVDHVVLVILARLTAVAAPAMLAGCRCAGPGGAVGAPCRQARLYVLDPLPARRLPLPMPPACAPGVTIGRGRAGRAYPGVMTLTVHLPGELAAALEAEGFGRDR